MVFGIRILSVHTALLSLSTLLIYVELMGDGNRCVINLGRYLFETSAHCVCDACHSAGCVLVG